MQFIDPSQLSIQNSALRRPGEVQTTGGAPWLDDFKWPAVRAPPSMDRIGILRPPGQWISKVLAHGFINIIRFGRHEKGLDTPNLDIINPECIGYIYSICHLSSSSCPVS